MAKPIKIAVGIAIGIGVIGMAVSSQMVSPKATGSAANTADALRLERCDSDDRSAECSEKALANAPVEAKAQQKSKAASADRKAPTAHIDYRQQARRMRREREAQVSPAAAMLSQGTGPRPANAPAPKPPVDRRNDPPPMEKVAPQLADE